MLIKTIQKSQGVATYLTMSNITMEDIAMSDAPLPKNPIPTTATTTNSNESIRQYLYNHHKANQAAISNLKVRRDILRAAEDASINPDLELILSALQARYKYQLLLNAERKEVGQRNALVRHGACCEVSSTRWVTVSKWKHANGTIGCEDAC